MEGLLAEINKKKEDLSSGSKYVKRGDLHRAKEEEETRRKEEARKRKLDGASAAIDQRATKLRKEVSGGSLGHLQHG